MLNRLEIFVIAVFLSYGTNAVGQDFYVSPTGNDRATGTSEKPLKTVSEALSRAPEGSEAPLRIILLDGTYTLDSTITIQRKKNVSIEAAPAASPLFEGEISLRKWKRLKGKNAGSVLEIDLGKAGVKDLGSALDRNNHVDLYCDGKLQRLSRWPNEGFLTSGEALGATPKEPYGTEEAVFSYLEDRISTWADEPDAGLFGYFYWDWLDGYRKIASFDTTHKVIAMEDDSNGIRSGFRYYGVNLLCELDSPGEYYIDRRSGKLYWFPPEDYDGKEEVTLSLFSGKEMMHLSDCEHVTIKGISFVGGRESAVGIEGCRDIVFERVNIDRFGGDAVHLSESKDVRIDGCSFGTLGHSGIRAAGGDRRTLEGAGYVIHNTLVHDFSLFKHTYEPAVLFDGCGLTISHCEFYNSYSSALRINGSDVLIEYNHFHDLVQESDDQGALDMFGNFSYRGVLIRYNLWENIVGGSLHGSAGVRFDDMISGQRVYGNIFRNVGGVHFGGVQIHGGKDNVVENNVFYRCLGAVSFSPWTEEDWLGSLSSEKVQKQIHEQVDIDSRLYRERFPELNETPESNRNRNFIRNNLAVGCQSFTIRDEGYNELENNRSVNMGSDPEIRPLEDYLSPEYLRQFGLEPIPYQEIGRTNPGL